jgi:hypothetical protein
VSSDWKSKLINSYFLTFECLIYILFISALWHAHRKRDFRVLELVWAALFGFLLEWITLKQLHAYQYGRFLMMIDDAPLCIALGWAVIIYSSMEFSSRIQLPDYARPILDALMALNIDLAFDIIAIRLGMWVWNGVPLDHDWFGVPWANLWAWFIIVWSFSTFIRALRTWQQHPIRRWFYAPLAVILSLVSLMIANELYRFMSLSLTSGSLSSLLLVCGSSVIVLELRPRILRTNSRDLLMLAVPLAFHIFGAVAGISTGIFSKQPIIGVIAITMLILSLIEHVLLWWFS